MNQDWKQNNLDFELLDAILLYNHSTGDSADEAYNLCKQKIKAGANVNNPMIESYLGSVPDSKILNLLIKNGFDIFKLIKNCAGKIEPEFPDNPPYQEYIRIIDEKMRNAWRAAGSCYRPEDEEEKNRCMQTYEYLRKLACIRILTQAFMHTNVKK